jgi:putative solute:sodium symporter small subunit
MPSMPPESAPPANPSSESELLRQRRLVVARARHWQRTRRLTAVLLALWLATGFCTVYFARELARVTVFGWPLSFYMAAQGESLICLAIIGVYAWRMRRFDRDLARSLDAGRLDDRAGVAE